MPTKKRKYEARFPPARIKKIMQTDEEIGKVAAAVPVIISRSLEIFLQSLVETTAKYTSERKAKTMTTAHLKHCIEAEKKFDFLKDLVMNIADISTQEEEECMETGDKIRKSKKPRATGGERKRRKKGTDDDESGQSSENEETVNVFPSQPSVSTMMSSIASSSHRSSHSIDSIIGNASSETMTSPRMTTQQFLATSDVDTNPSFNLLQQNCPSFPTITSTTLPMTFSTTKTDEQEDDDYDT